jgi:hypothetical protein
MARRFKVGDRFTALHKIDNVIEINDSGVVIGVSLGIGLTVELDNEQDDLHDASGMGRPRRCWHTNEENLRRQYEELEITTNAEPDTRVRLRYDTPGEAGNLIPKGECGRIIGRADDQWMDTIGYFVVEFDNEMAGMLEDDTVRLEGGRTMHVVHRRWQYISPWYLEREIEVRRIIWGENDTKTITFD